jgi:hypothetical protein
MVSLPIKPPPASSRPRWAGGVVFVILLLAAALVGLSSLGSATAIGMTVQAGHAAASDVAGCHQPAASATAIQLHESDGGWTATAPVSCPQTGSACCGTACHAAANQVESPRLSPPSARTLAVGSILPFAIKTATPGRFRPPIG